MSVWAFSHDGLTIWYMVAFFAEASRHVARAIQGHRGAGATGQQRDAGHVTATLTQAARNRLQTRRPHTSKNLPPNLAARRCPHEHNQNTRVDLYRMVMETHICPFGLKSLHFLESEGFKVNDPRLTTRSETDAFKQKHVVDTTPQTFIDGKRIGGNDDSRKYLGKPVKDSETTTYTPRIAVFAMAALMALMIDAVGAVSVYYAVYVQKRDLKCACMSRNSNVPLGCIPLTDNLMMLAMDTRMPPSAAILKGRACTVPSRARARQDPRLVPVARRTRLRDLQPDKNVMRAKHKRRLPCPKSLP